MKNFHKDGAYFRKVAMIKLALAATTNAKLGLAGGLASKGYQSYTTPGDNLYEARVAYLKSRYLPGGYLKRIADGIDSVRLAIHNQVGRPQLKDNY